MNHSFLLRPAKWHLEGLYTKQGKTSFPSQGEVSITWKRESWFKIETRLTIGESVSEIVTRCKGHLDSSGKSYTYVLQHSILGNIEGEGYFGSDSIVQYYWVVGSTKRCLGFDTFYYLSQSEYHLTSVFLENHDLKNTMEAKLNHLI